MKQLKVIAEVLDLERSGSVANITERIMLFSLEPKDSGRKPPAPKSKRTSGAAKSRKSTVE